MVEITINDKPHGLDDIRSHVLMVGLEGLLDPMSKGHVPKDIPPENGPDRYFGSIVRQMKNQSQSLNHEESVFLSKIEKLVEKLASFDRGHYLSIRGEWKEAYAVSYGKGVAEILESLAEGFKLPEGHYSPLAHPKESYAWMTSPKSAIIKDKNGIGYPLGLKIKNSDEETKSGEDR